MYKITRAWFFMVVVLLVACDKGSEQTDHEQAVNTGKAQEAQPLVAAHSAANYVGGKACIECHAEQHAAWQGSHHDQAMQVAKQNTVLGDFNNATFQYHNIKTTFFREQDKFMVRTDGPDGKLKDYLIKYTFGVEPLQQYLIEFDDGRVQALGIAWDSRSEAQGGQRWFHLYPGEKVDYKHELHWSGRQQNWNFMCAECHSTRLEKKYHAANDTFTTSYSEINVACEACHGPGSNHAAGATSNERRPGLPVTFDERKDVQWIINEDSGNARRSKPRHSSKELDTCARCHSRRSLLSENFVHGRPIGDTHRIALLEENLYFSDGQPKDETYVYGSFLQSKMYHQGVTCSDCHEPHSLKLRAEGERVCYQCHQASKYANIKHHFHAENSAGSSCIECHMPVKTFMVVDPRHDHSFRLPRPDLTLKLGTPNACNQCHADKSAAWAAAKISDWNGRPGDGFQHYAQLLQEARRGNPAVRKALILFVKDKNQPAIARATAMSYLPRYMSRDVAEALTALTHNREPLIRRSSVEALAQIEAAARVRWLAPLLSDSVKDVRLAAARALADIEASQLPVEVQNNFQHGLDEYIASQQLNADRPEAQVNLGTLYMARRNAGAAEAAFKQALKLDADFVPALVNLADLYRAMGQDREGEELLRTSLKRLPDDASLNHAIGLLQVRQNKTSEGLGYLTRAAKQAPLNVRYNYVYAVALNSSGKTEEAINVLTSLLENHPFERDSLWAIYSFYLDRGENEKAQRYLERLKAIEPDNPQFRK